MKGILRLIRNKRSLLSLMSIFLTLGLVVSLTVQASPTPGESFQGYFIDIRGNRQPLTREVRDNNQKLLDAYCKLVDTSEFLRKNQNTPPLGIGCGASYALDSLGIPVAGVYIDVVTNTLHIGLSDIKEDWTFPIRKMVGEDINLQFFKAKFTYKDLRDFQKRIADNMLGFRKKGIPITSVGIDVVQNSIIVGLEEVKPFYMEEIRIIVGRGVPLLFEKSRFQKLSGKTSYHQQLFGGIRISSRIGSSSEVSTLGFSATLSDGTRGFVMTGHAGGEGTVIYQPLYLWYWPPTWSDQVGIIIRNPPQSPRWSDAAFVRTTNPDRPPINRIWLSRTITSWKSSMYTPIGTTVYMEGQYTSSSGLVTRISEVIMDDINNVMVLYGQTIFNVSPTPQEGDSGAPIFISTNDPDKVEIVGIFVGCDNIHDQGPFPRYFFSPLEGVWYELHVIWGSS